MQDATANVAKLSITALEEMFGEKVGNSWAVTL
jgi:hypothetical protein